MNDRAAGHETDERKTSSSLAPAGAAVLFALCLLGVGPAAALAAPPNDNFAAATPLSGASVTAKGTTAEATKEPGEPNHAGAVGGQSVWWQWTAPATGGVTVDTCESILDTVLAVYTGTAVNALTSVASDDDSCDVEESSLSFTATAGQQYWIAVDSRDDSGSVTIRIQPTLKVEARNLRRPRRVDATRFNIEAAALGDDLADAPRLVLRRGSKRVSIDLDIDNEGDFFSESKFRYTFEWSCDRAGSWRWTVSVRRGGKLISEEGSFTVPRCTVRRWYVPRSHVVNEVRRDLGSGVARELRCRAAGATKGGRSPAWTCGLAKPGFRCTGSLRFRYRRLFQGADVVENQRKVSGTVTCRR